MRTQHWLLLAAAIGGTPTAGVRVPQCPTQGGLVEERCTLTQPNFTQWCKSGEAEPEHSEYYYFTSALECVKSQPLRFDISKGDPFSASKCTLCAPFTELEECRRVCEEGYEETTKQEASELIAEVDLQHFGWNLFIALYACYGLALCCEDFFVSSLEILIDRAGMPPDVAGATFMAAGSSSPELFVAAVTIFAPSEADVCQVGQACVHKDPGLGVGTVVGSTMFNTMCIIGGSAIISGKTTTLDWRIVARDGCSYCVAILTLLWFLTDEVCEKGQCMVDTDVNGDKVGAVDMEGWGTIHVGEAAAMIGVYAAYVVLCWKYSKLTERFCSGGKEGIDPEVEDWISSFQAPPASPEAAVAAAAAAAGERSLRESNAQEQAAAAVEQARFTVRSLDDADSSTDGGGHGDGHDEDDDGEGHGHESRDETCLEGLSHHLLTPPSSLRDKIVWVISLPLMTCFCLTIIDCRNRRFEKYYPATMLTAICCK